MASTILSYFPLHYTSKNAQGESLSTEILQQTCYNKPISGWVRMACDSLLKTSLLQVDCQNLLSTGLLQVDSTSCNKFSNDKLQQA